MTSKLRIVTQLKPDIMCGFRRNDKIEMVRVTECIRDNGAIRNTIVFEDGTTMEVMNGTLIFNELPPDLVE